MKKKYMAYIIIQILVIITIFLVFIQGVKRYRNKERDYRVNNISQALSYAIQEYINTIDVILSAFEYNYEIDKKIDIKEFEILASKYIESTEHILYIQYKDKDTITKMVYPHTYDYTLGATLKERKEVEEATKKALNSRKATVNEPFMLKDTEGLLGLIIRQPIYIEDEFQGFFVAVLDLESYISNITKEIMPDPYGINLYDSKGELFWGNTSKKAKDLYKKDIKILDDYWTMEINKEYSGLLSSESIIYISVVILLTFIISVSILRIMILNKDKIISELENVHNELMKVKESYSLALDSANDALWEWNLVNNDIITSDKWLEITGNELTGVGLDAIVQEDAVHKQDYERVISVFEQCLVGRTPDFYTEYRMKNEFGNYSWVQNRGKAYYDEDGIITKMAGAILNIDERKQKESDIEYMAYYDVLTGLPNKIKFMDTLNNIIEDEINFQHVSILMMDLDDFKEYNDLLGLELCDTLLKIIGRNIVKIVGQNNMVARYGGDEFLILVNDKNALDEIEDLCNDIINLFERPFIIQGNTIYLTASIGVVYGIDNNRDGAKIMRNADIALNKAKERGKNQYCLYDNSMHREIARRSQVENSIRTGLEEDGFILNYQPQKNLEKDSIERIEVLTRLKSKELGIVSPLEFIAVAEYTGLIIPLGNWIIENACIQGKKWLDNGYKLGKLAINISVKQLYDYNFYDNIMDILYRTKFPTNKLEFEITESFLLNSSNKNIELLKRIQKQGISIALDDFGTGYSSLNYLTELPINILKIDKSFLDKGLKEEKYEQVIRSIIELAHNLELEVVAEGAETYDQVQVLRNMNCDYIQGYYLAKPVNEKEVIKYLSV